ncbi:hypothetical protein SteCoe_16888 [Stentor coeruleus]|uniref:Uncharacterized protein n=1 Tax=Stentor coeruleus TaxID=5963 RepID=A0A1R2C057_9CILI|nr:hypothetical protein SteCoe_16888 [Stentor coeruleus]
MNAKALSLVLANPEISTFLAHYPISERAEVIKLTILHSIYSLKSSYQSHPSFGQLKEILTNAGKIQSLESVVIQMKEKLEGIKREIGTLEYSLNKNPPEEIPYKDHKGKILDFRPSLYEKIKEPQPKSFYRSRSAPHITKAPSDWRQGDPAVFRNRFAEISPLREKTYKEFITPSDIVQSATHRPNEEDNIVIYPEWWKALSELDVKPARLTAKVTQHVPPKPTLKQERRQWPEYQQEPKTIIEEQVRTLPPRQKPQPTVKFSPKTSEKSIEAQLESAESLNNEAKVHFNHKKYSGWVGDFTKAVKTPKSRTSNSISKEISYAESSKKDHSSGYTSSSMTNYVPSSEMRQFYQGEFNRFLESKNGESYASGRLRSPYHNSLSSEDHKGSFE